MRESQQTTTLKIKNKKMSSEEFSLKWNDFASNVSNSFFKLRQETRLYDVTLVSNDHQQVSAHKLVLSACSEVFSNIFNSNNSSNMMLYLDSVDVKEVNFMLDYIYQGSFNFLEATSIKVKFRSTKMIWTGFWK